MPALKGSFSFIVAKRMLSALEENGPTGRTNLAVHCRLNYNVCLKYINMLRMLGWVDVRHGKSTQITITKMGSEVNAKLFRYAGLDVNESFADSSLEGIIADTLAENASRLRTSARSSQQARSQAKRDRKGRPNVMLVDDEPDILLTYRSFLAPNGYNVEGVSDPYSALQKVASKASYFDLIVLDIRMPGINGLQLYQSLRIMSPSSRFLFVSSLDAARELVTVLPEVKQEQVMQKPIDRDLFLRKVQSILAQ